MTSNQFQIQKEIQAKKVNEILQSVKLNSFPKEAKEKVIELCESAIGSIDKLRIEVYKKTENFDYEPEKYDHSESRLQKNIEIIANGKPVGKLQNSLLNSVSQLIDQVERLKIDRITGDNFSNLEKTKEYKDNEKALLETLEALRDAILIKEKEEKKEEETSKEADKIDDDAKIDNAADKEKTEEQLFEEQLAAEKALLEAKNNTENTELGTGNTDSETESGKID
jgi:hypothetical protein